MIECIVCSLKKINTVFKVENQPLARYGLVSSRAKAMEAKLYPIEIVECLGCGHIFNSLFRENSVDYTDAEVQESRVFSEKIKSFMSNEAKKIKEHLKKNETVLEIGCGEGFFLNQFKDEFKCIGYEPSPEGYEAEKLGLNIKHKYFEKNDLSNQKPGLIIMRQVLEHIANPYEFLSQFNLQENNKKDELHIYLEVPNGEKTKKRNRFHDFYYEHVSYFTPTSIIALLNRSGFDLVELKSSFDDEIIQVLAKRSVVKMNYEAISYDEKMSQIKNKLNEWKSLKKKVVGWGTAGNGSMFFSVCDIKIDEIEFVVDSDKRKQEKFLPKTGQLVISPDMLKKIKPDVIIVLSQFHSVEIAQQAKGLLGDDVEVVNFF